MGELVILDKQRQYYSSNLDLSNVWFVGIQKTNLILFFKKVTRYQADSSELARYFYPVNLRNYS